MLVSNLKWQHKSFLHYSLRIMLIPNGGTVTSSLFTYEAKTCHGSILTVEIVGEVRSECSHSQLGLIRLLQNDCPFSRRLQVCFCPNISSGSAEESARDKCSKTGFSKNKSQNSGSEKKNKRTSWKEMTSCLCFEKTSWLPFVSNTYSFTNVPCSTLKEHWRKFFFPVLTLLLNH